jgi:diguanylate cyclase (GGDEF)-like protein
MGGVLARQGDLAAAVEHYKAAAAAFATLGDLYQVARQHLNMAQHLWRMGDLDGACAALTRCQVICEGDRFLQLAWAAHELRSRIAERRGRTDIALASLRTAWSIQAALVEARSAERVRLLELHAEAEKARLEAELAQGRTLALEALAYRDTLTGLANRRSMSERLEAELARARRRNRPLLVAMVDVDFFKQINDTLGHASGDEVLVELAGRLVRALRREDVVGRWGGEEFCVLCPDTNAEAGEAVLQRLVAAVKAAPVETKSGAVRVTVSVGATLLATTDKLGNDPLSRADAALYAAKRAGRDRFVLWHSLVTEA